MGYSGMATTYNKGLGATVEGQLYIIQGLGAAVEGQLHINTEIRSYSGRELYIIQGLGATVEGNYI